MSSLPKNNRNFYPKPLQRPLLNVPVNVPVPVFSRIYKPATDTFSDKGPKKKVTGDHLNNNL